MTPASMCFLFVSMLEARVMTFAAHCTLYLPTPKFGGVEKYGHLVYG